MEGRVLTDHVITIEATDRQIVHSATEVFDQHPWVDVVYLSSALTHHLLFQNHGANVLDAHRQSIGQSLGSRGHRLNTSDLKGDNVFNSRGGV
ncbi:hypothetical protein D3C73_1218180 [compost metagenome]